METTLVLSVRLRKIIALLSFFQKLLHLAKCLGNKNTAPVKLTSIGGQSLCLFLKTDKWERNSFDYLSFIQHCLLSIEKQKVTLFSPRRSFIFFLSDESLSGTQQKSLEEPWIDMLLATSSHRGKKKNYKHLWFAIVIVFRLRTLPWLAWWFFSSIISQDTSFYGL